jgi:hypothetical protein
LPRFSVCLTRTLTDPATFVVPHTFSDYFCKLCSAELSNTYFHCLGCERLLSKDMNICQSCFEEGKQYAKVRMHPIHDRWLSHMNHVADTPRGNKGKGCSCQQAICGHCKYCSKCSCRCHQMFQRNQRFFDTDELESILETCEKVAK